MNTIRLAPWPINTKNFSECGQLIGSPQRPPDVQNENINFWDKVVRCEIDGKPDIGYLELSHRPFRVTQMERHVTHTQGFIPLEGGELILVTAPPTPGDRPILETIRAFSIDGSCGIILHEGTWHDILFPLGSSARIVSILREGTSIDDMFIVDLVNTYETEIVIDVD